jgi:hypothetical protein
MAEVSIPDVAPAVKTMVDKVVAWSKYWCGVALWLTLPLLMIRGTWVALQMSGVGVPQPTGAYMAWAALCGIYVGLCVCDYLKEE